MAVAENHGGISTALKLVDIEGKGRGLVASQPLKGGQIVLRDSPILTYSSFSLKQRQGAYSRYCAHCYKLLVSGNGTLACPSCCHPDDAIFCSSKCQSSALVFSHTPWVCQSLSYLRNCPVLVDQQPEDRQIQARYLVAAFNLAMVSPSSFQTLISLDGGGPQGAERDSNAAIFLHSIISSLPFPKGLSAPSVEITAALLSKDRCNSFGLMEPFSEHGERSVRAYAIYRNASFFNHDCLPNACRFDYVDGGTEETKSVVLITGTAEYNMVSLNSTLKAYLWEMGSPFLPCRTRSGLLIAKAHSLRMWLKDSPFCFDLELKNAPSIPQSNSMQLMEGCFMRRGLVPAFTDIAERLGEVRPKKFARLTLLSDDKREKAIQADIDGRKEKLDKMKSKGGVTLKRKVGHQKRKFVRKSMASNTKKMLPR